MFQKKVKECAKQTTNRGIGLTLIDYLKLWNKCVGDRNEDLKILENNFNFENNNILANPNKLTAKMLSNFKLSDLKEKLSHLYVYYESNLLLKILAKILLTAPSFYYEQNFFCAKYNEPSTSKS